MTSVQGFCGLHRGRPARRRCYFCRQWLCPTCQQRIAHHIFCSRQCYWAWRWDVTRQHVLRWLQAHGLRLAVVAVLVSLGWTAWWVLILWHHRMDANTMALQTQPVTPLPQRPEPLVQPIRIVRPAYGARLASDTIIVEGQGPPHQAMTLWLNGEPVRTVSSDARGRFVFSNIPLAAADNLLQIHVHLPSGVELYSPAIVVYRVQHRRAAHTRFVQPGPDHLAQGNPSRREVALTFDGNLSDRDVSDLLRQLDWLQVPVTVFLTGTFIHRFPESTRRLAESRWVEVGNHTLTHRHWTSYARDRRQTTLDDVAPRVLQFELQETARRFYRVTGRVMAPLWRAPYGEHNVELRRWAATLGYTHVGWTVGRGWSLDTLDWIDDPAHPLYRTAPVIVRRILELADRHPGGIAGGIVLMHLGTRRPRGDRMVDVLPEMVQGLRRRGYRLVFVTTMLRHLKPGPPMAVSARDRSRSHQNPRR